MAISAIQRLHSVGGSGGTWFDSGVQANCRLRRIHVQTGASLGGANTIMRIYLEHEHENHYHNHNHYHYHNHNDNPNDSNNGCERKRRYPEYANQYRSARFFSSTFSFEVDREDSIIVVNVWTDNNYVSAIQFITRDGTHSQVYGTREENQPPTIFRGPDDSWEMAGIHGRYGWNIDKLGVTFAQYRETQQQPLLHPHIHPHMHPQQAMAMSHPHQHPHPHPHPHQHPHPEQETMPTATFVGEVVNTEAPTIADDETIQVAPAITIDDDDHDEQPRSENSSTPPAQ